MPGQSPRILPTSARQAVASGRRRSRSLARRGSLPERAARRDSPERRGHLDVHVPTRADGADAVAALALGPGEVVTDAELAADERRVLLAEGEPAALAPQADDGERRCRAGEDDRLLERPQSPPHRAPPALPGPRPSRTASATM